MEAKGLAAGSPRGENGDAPAALLRSSGRSAPFSMHSRGVQLIDYARLLDVRLQLRTAFQHLRDLGSSLFTLVLAQNWLTVFSVILTVVSCSFYTYFSARGFNTTAFYLDWTLVCFVVVLPTLGFLWLAYQRREGALKDLAEVKSLLLHISLAHRDWLPPGAVSPIHHATVMQQLFSLVDCFRAYFLPPRFYTRHYPLTGIKTGMMHIAQERSKSVRRITACFKRLSRSAGVLRKAGLPDSQCGQLAAYGLQLQTAFERMAATKEYRTPQGIRAMSRFYIVLVIPLFFGPYYAELRQGAHGYAYALFLAIMLHTALVSMLNVSIALEDPWDNQGLDGIYIDESLFEAEQAIALDEDSELMTSEDGLQQIGTGVAADAATLAPPLSPRPTPQPQGSPRRVQDDEQNEDVVLDLPPEAASPRGAHADGDGSEIGSSLT